MTKVVIYTLQRYLQTGAEAALSTVWYLQGPMPKLVIYTARLSTHYATDQSKWAHGCLLGRGRALPVCTTGDLSADTRMAAITFNELLGGGSIRLPKSPTCTCSAGCAGLAVVRNVIMEISPKVPVPKSCNVEALRANTTSAAFSPPKSQE